MKPQAKHALNRLAWLDSPCERLPLKLYSDISSELRRLHGVNQGLLEALDAAMKLIELVMPIDGDVTRKARAAITKATGEQT